MRPRSLYRRIYMHFLGVLLAVGVLSSFIFAGGNDRTYLADLASRLVAHTSALLGHQPNDRARVELLGELAAELQLDAALYDADHRLLASFGRILPKPDADAWSLTTPALRRSGYRFYIVAPVRPNGARPLVLTCTSTRLARWAFPARPALMLFAVMVVVALAVKPLARRISRPIEWLIVASRRFGEGDLTTRVRLPAWQDHAARWHRHWHRRWRRRHLGDELLTLMHTWNDMAERIERQVGAQRELLANVSHELRSPLARVRVALALLPDEAATRKRIADIEADLAELDALIEQILQTSRLEATGLPSHTERFAVSTLFEEVLARAAADPVTAPLGTAVDAARSPDTIVIDGDRALLRRALFNLIENAAKYGAAPVTLAIEREGGGIALVVEDAGTGIPVDERERVLRPFSRGDRAHTPGRGGVGLGLSFASRVAEVHGGKLSLGDTPRRGLRVCLQLPPTRVVT
jgi:signal transduction histidine kinase